MGYANSSHDTPMVSVIVPIYNTGQYLNRCIKSIVEQTYSHLDIILVDDGSTDDSILICKDFASRDSRIRLFSQQNGGASAARNKGLDNADGQYVMFVDSDDWIEANMAETLLEGLKSSKTDMIISHVPMDRQFSQSLTIGKSEALPILLDGAWWGPVGKLFSHSAIRDIRFPQATISEDYVFMLHTIINSEQIIYTPECYYHREIREGSLSRLPLSERKFEEFDNVSYVADYIRENYPQYHQLAEARMAETSLKLLYAIYNSGNIKDFSSKKTLFIKSIQENILRYLINGHIMLKQRFLLALCTTSAGSHLAYFLNSRISR